MYTPILTELAATLQPAAAGIVSDRPASGCPARPEAQPAATPNLSTIPPGFGTAASGFGTAASGSGTAAQGFGTAVPGRCHREAIANESTPAVSGSSTAVAGPTRATGPRTPEGKAASSRNATKHGLLSTAAILTPDESPEDWHEFCRDVCQTLAPVGTLEVAVAVRIAHIHWRVARVPHCEVDAFLAGDDDDEGDDPWPDRPFPPARPVAAQPAAPAAAAPALPDSRALARIQRYEAHLARELTRATQYFDDLQAKRIARAAQASGTAVPVRCHREAIQSESMLAMSGSTTTPGRSRSVSSHPAAAGGSRPQPDVPYVPDCPYAEIHFPDANDALKQALASMRKNCETNTSPGHFTSPRPQAPVPCPDPTPPQSPCTAPREAASVALRSAASGPAAGSGPASGFPAHTQKCETNKRRAHARHSRATPAGSALPHAKRHR